MINLNQPITSQCQTGPAWASLRDPRQLTAPARPTYCTLKVTVSAGVSIIQCGCVRLTHSFEGGIFVESHCAVVAVRLWKTLSEGPISGVIQVVLFW